MIDIIIITWNNRVLVERCLASIVRTAPGVPYSVIVVDNGSTDGTIEMIRRDYPEVELVRNRVNRGVARARNQGLGRSDKKYSMLLDADAELTGGALSALVDFMENHGEVGLAGPRLNGRFGDLQLSCRRFPTVATPVVRRLAGWSWVNDSNVLRRYLMTDVDHAHPMAVDYVIGACQIIRRTARAEVGFLDEKIFYGPEDIDYCLRMWHRGWKVYYCPQATVIHHEQRMTKRNPFSIVGLRHFLALFYFFKKYRFRLAKHLPKRGLP